MAGTVHSRKDGKIGWMQFDNVKRHNAMSFEMWEVIPAILQDMERDPSIRVVVLHGAGDRAFVSGADISEFEQKRSTPEAVKLYDVISEAAENALKGFSKPLIAMIKGYCIGGGLALALDCDLRIAASDAKFGIPAAKLGLGYDFDGIKHLTDIVGPATAKEIFFTGRLFDSSEAHHMGLVNHVLAPTELEAYVTDYAMTIAENAPLTIKAAKFAIGQATKGAAAPELSKAQALVTACFESADYIEGRRAFKERRKPNFQGT